MVSVSSRFMAHLAKGDSRASFASATNAYRFCSRKTGSAAFELPAIDRPSKQAAPRSANDRADRAVAPAVEFAPDERADRGTDNQPGRAVVAAATIAPVVTAPDTVATRNPPRLIIAAIAVVEPTVLGARKSTRLNSSH